MLQAEGRVVMVSGASRGIGRAIVDRLFASGFRVSGGMRDPSRLSECDRILSSPYEAEQVGAAEAWVERTIERFGRIDAVVNAAGIDPKVRAIDDDEDELDRMWRVNVKGPMRIVRAAYPHLAASGQGRVVNLGSLASKRVTENVGYSMSKFALAALTHGIRREGRDAGIRATIVCPGAVATDMTAGFTAYPPSEMIQPEDLAVLVETLIQLPNNASVSELLVHCKFEPML